MITVAEMLHVYRPFFSRKAKIDPEEAVKVLNKLSRQLHERVCSSSGEKPGITDEIFDDYCVGAIRGWLEKYPNTYTGMVCVYIRANDALTEMSVEVHCLTSSGSDMFCKKTEGFDAAFKEDEEKFISRFSLKKKEPPYEPPQKVKVTLPSGEYEAVLSGEDLEEFRKEASRACVLYTLKPKELVNE